MRGTVSRLRARVRIAAALALALEVFTAMNVSPAAAQTGSASGAFCATNLGLLPAFNAFTPAGGARGDTRKNEPDTGARAEAPASPKAGANFRATVPVAPGRTAAAVRSERAGDTAGPLPFPG